MIKIKDLIEVTNLVDDLKLYFAKDQMKIIMNHLKNLNPVHAMSGSLSNRKEIILQII